MIPQITLIIYLIFSAYITMKGTKHYVERGNEVSFLDMIIVFFIWPVFAIQVLLERAKGEEK